MRHRAYAVVALSVLVLGIAACGNDSGDDTATTGAPEVTTAPEATTAPDDTDSPGEEGFVPELPLPEDLPVFPGAVLWSDIPSAVPYLYLFSASGTNQEICEFYVSALGDMGFDVSTDAGFNDCSYADQEYYVDARRDGATVVQVTYGEDSEGGGAGYVLGIDHDLWENG